MTYTREEVEDVLFQLWDSDRFYGLAEIDRSPAGVTRDPEGSMPTGASNPLKATDWMLALIDVQQAWDKAELTTTRRRRLFMRYGLHWDEQAIATAESCTQQSVNKALLGGVGQLVDYLNGEESLATLYTDDSDEAELPTMQCA